MIPKDESFLGITTGSHHKESKDDGNDTVKPFIVQETVLNCF